MINYYDFLNESFMNNPNFKKKILKLAIAGALGAPVLSTIFHSPAFTNKEKEEISRVVPIEDIIPNYYEHVNSVENHIKRVFGLHDYDFNDLKLSPEFLVKLCFENNYDITLLLAQLQFESLYGMTPLAVKYNNPLSINITDNGKRKYYISQETCAEDYIDMMQEYYLADKSVDELLCDGGFTNIYGRRYASNPKYEKILRQIRNRIIKDYPILLQLNIQPDNNITFNNYNYYSKNLDTYKI